MTLRQRLLLAFAGVVVLAVAMVAWVVSLRTRATFEQADQQRTSALIAQFRKEFQVQGDDIGRMLERMSNSERLQRIAFEATHGGDTSLYIHEAAGLAQEYQLDFLELLTSDGTILSSAQTPARFGYRENIPSPVPSAAFLSRVETVDSATLGLMAIRPIHAGDGTIYISGGRKLDQTFLQSLSLPESAYFWLYGSSAAAITSQEIIGNTPAPIASLTPLIREAQARGQEITGTVQLSTDRFDRATVQSVPLRDDTGSVAAVLLVGTSRRPLLELQQHIRLIAFSVAGVGILLAISASLWIASRFSRPIEQLAAASREVSSGHWDAHVPVTSSDEIGQLAESFNSMTSQLVQQRDRLVQSERVAAWRELARRLAHELKNPLFPLQITVENLSRSRQLPAEEFDEVFRESTSTLLAEITNLKNIIGRFSDFSKMPRPQLQPTSINDLVQQVSSLLQAQLASSTPPAQLITKLDGSIPAIPLDPDLIYRAVSNLVLNAVDAMPEGGTVTVSTHDSERDVSLEVRDTGTGLTPEERDRLFTPYYTTKHHGTGLGLAIVQSVVSDHGGSISVMSEPGKGTAFIIRLPKHPADQAISNSTTGASA